MFDDPAVVLSSLVGDSPSFEFQDVALRTLTVTPSSIGPFDEALLRWEVVTSGPAGVTTLLNNDVVAPSGVRTERPERSTRYTVSALADNAKTVLGSVVLEVDLSTCEVLEVFPRQQLAGAVSKFSTGGDIYEREKPTVSIQQDRIAFSTRLKRRVALLPDFLVDIDGSFGLVVVDGQLQSDAEQISARVKAPLRLYAAAGLPFSVNWAPIALWELRERIRDGERLAEQGGRQLIQGLVAWMRLVYSFGADRRLHSVKIDPQGDGTPVVAFRHCPQPPFIERSSPPAERSRGLTNPPD